ncbi:cAMP-dependent protein kinase inhibitor gamma isoform X2 [Amia ocellicauda]|uniref:cAMP-dependent protein kinase inhibitor gamma isoform X2 n=1 Tax=Amia ocellicauda TaxID=2972642 RepID=UPI0034648649
MCRCYESCGDEKMMEVESAYSDFITCDRTGRRNAVPDIKGEGTVVGTSELTKDMAQMDLKVLEGEAAAASLPPEVDVAGAQKGKESEGPS